MHVASYISKFEQVKFNFVVSKLLSVVAILIE